jgi:hypothetical protein
MWKRLLLRKKNEGVADFQLPIANWKVGLKTPTAVQKRRDGRS